MTNEEKILLEMELSDLEAVFGDTPELMSQDMLDRVHEIRKLIKGGGCGE